MNDIVDSLFQYLSTDGYNRTHKYQTLSNRGAFGSLYMSVFGSRDSFAVGFVDTTGIARTSRVSLYAVARDNRPPAGAPAQPLAP
jgi:hypothetical protein